MAETIIIIESAQPQTSVVFSADQGPQGIPGVTGPTGPTGAGMSFSPTYLNRKYSGTGSQYNFTVSSGCTVNNVLVFINGICQMPTDDYTISGTVLSFIVAPGGTAVIQIRELPR